MRPFIAVALVKPKRVVEIFVFVTVLLVLLNCAVLALKYEFGHENLYGLVRFFDLDDEDNAPTFFAELQLLSCSALLAYTAVLQGMTNKHFTLHWGVLSMIFLYLAFDEASSVHEKWMEPLRAVFHASGIFYFAWVIVAIPLLILFLVAFAKFMIALPFRTRALFILSGAVYVAGAVGMELAGSWYWDRFGPDHPMYAVLTTVEETLEMSGLDLFIYSALDHIGATIPQYQLTVTGPTSTR